MFSTPLPARRRTAAVALLAAVVAIALAVLLVVTRGGSDDAGTAPDGSPSAAPTATPTTPVETPSGTSLEDYDTASLTVQRADFCDLVPSADVEAALEGTPTASSTYGNGESTALTSEVTDIAAEHGCRWKRGPIMARAWVFAPPVTADDGARLARAARRADGCVVRRGAPAYGSATLARTCPAGKGHEASYRGLFGDAWLVCSLTRPGARAATLEAAGTWCVAVAEAAAQPPA